MVHLAVVPNAESGDLVVITDRRSLSYGRVGRMTITPGWETVEVDMDGVIARMYPEGVRRFRLGEKVADVEGKS